MSEIRDLAIPSNPVDAFRRLDVFAGGLVDAEPSVDWLATISAGERGPDGSVRRTKQGEIYLHDSGNRAPGLRAVLEQNDWRWLTIAFPSNDLSDFIQMRFARYSRTRLEAYGDQDTLTVLDEKRGRVVLEADTAEYGREVKTCKVLTSVFFTLGSWEPDGSSTIVLPDGLSPYRLRFQSTNSLRNLAAALRSTAHYTRNAGGALAGIPFHLAIDFRDASDAKGMRHQIPVWTFTFRPPETIRLTSRTFARIVQQGLAEGAMLMLPAPGQETVEQALRESQEVDLDEPERDPAFVRTEAGAVNVHTGEVLPGRGESIELEQPSEAETELLARGGRCDAAHWEARWFAAVRGTRFDTAAARADFLREYSDRDDASVHTDSLATFLAHATEQDASALIGAVLLAIRVGDNAPASGPAELGAEEEGELPAEIDEPEPADEQPALLPATEHLQCSAIERGKPCPALLDPGAQYHVGGHQYQTGAEIAAAGRAEFGRVLCWPHLHRAREMRLAKAPARS